MTPGVAEMTEVGELNQNLWEDYEKAAGGPKELPPDGSYRLRFPADLPEEAFEVRTTEQDGTFLKITLDPVMIDGGQYDGTQVRFLRVDTRRIPEFAKGGNGGWQRTGKMLNASDAADVLVNFSTGDRPSTVEEWKAAFRRLCGQTTPEPVYLTWGGYDKKAQGSAKYLKSKDFTKMADGSRPPYIVRNDPATGEDYKVFANLTLGKRGFCPRA